MTMRKRKNWLKDIYNCYRNFILYAGIGCINTIVDLGIFAILDAVGVFYIIANLVSYHCSIICSFFLNKKYNFRVKDKVWDRFISFYLSSVVAMILSTGLLGILVRLFHLDPMIGKIIATIIIAILQFFYVKHYTFK